MIRITPASGPLYQATAANRRESDKASIYLINRRFDMQTDKTGASGPDGGDHWDLLAQEARIARTGCADRHIALVLDIDTGVSFLGAAPDSIVLTRTAALTMLLDLADEFELAVWHTAGPDETSAEAAIRNRVAATQAKRAPNRVLVRRSGRRDGSGSADFPHRGPDPSSAIGPGTQRRREQLPWMTTASMDGPPRLGNSPPQPSGI